MPRPTAQVQVPVASSIQISVQLASTVRSDLLDLPTQRALTRSLNSPLSADLDELHAYAHDDQLGPAGERWKGRKPADGAEDEFLTMLVVNDQIGPAMNREVSDQFAKDPEWDATKGAEKLEEKHEIVTAGTDWHREAGLTDAAKDAARSRFWAGRMVGRVYIPDEYQDRLLPTSAGRPRTLAEALDLIHVQAVDPREGGPVQDRHGRTLGYWYAYDQEVEGRSEDRRVVEVHTPTHVHKFQLRNGELEPLEDIPADSPFHDPAQPQRARRAEYLMWHADRDGGTAITKTAKHSQDRLTVVVTYHGRNDDQTGYRQLIVTNAEQPKNTKGQPVAFPMGPGVALNIRGLKKPKSGTQGLGSDEPDRHTPDIKVVEPLNPAEYHIPSEDAWKRRILEVFDQAYTLSPEVQVSGESKRVSRKPYDRRVAFAAQDTGAFIAWALRAALMLAAQILGKTAEYRDVTFQPKMYLDVDAVNLEELRVKLQMWESGALTLVSLLEATPGVTDAAKEAGRIEEGKGTGGTPENDKQAALDRLAKGGGGEGGGA
ncbi:hypothetical protein [Deinococcus radiotolerans]|uniref:Phage portal protein n=1 Tax=Deinococcus radiotolerans TaxID=1309407 RepID=A0ABQ2FQ71_9DEIO|nr:hypothetical protein [Deinococcus radiotolerans]GGL15747.1 hypothetical protein GCM10010844_38360 [Deinococcus radiotolerans]